MAQYRNFVSREGTLSGAVTVDFPWRPEMIQITNDSGSNLQFKFHAAEDYGTLKATETISVPNFSAREVFLSGSGAYRVWGWG